MDTPGLTVRQKYGGFIRGLWRSLSVTVMYSNVKAVTILLCSGRETQPHQSTEGTLKNWQPHLRSTGDEINYSQDLDIHFIKLSLKDVGNQLSFRYLLTVHSYHLVVSTVRGTYHCDTYRIELARWVLGWALWNFTCIIDHLSNSYVNCLNRMLVFLCKRKTAQTEKRCSCSLLKSTTKSSSYSRLG